MSETWYRTRHYGLEIEPVEVVKVTDKTVQVKERSWHGHDSISRVAIKSEWQQHFRTWEEAHEYLMDRAQQKVESLRIQLQTANGFLGNVKGLKKP